MLNNSDYTFRSKFGNYYSIFTWWPRRVTNSRPSRSLEAIVVDCDKVPLLEQMWLHAFNNILKTFLVGSAENDLEKVILTTKKDLESTYSYKPNMVRQGKIHLKFDAVPKIIHPRRVPYAKINAKTQ
ncbi:unnamed protein product [Gordionus sp. m RMFG-2023]